MNTATKMIAEIAVSQYEDLDFCHYEIEEAQVRNFLRDLADEILGCEVGPEDGEFPEWTTLVATPAIEKTIDWEAVAQAVITDLKENETANCYGCCGIYLKHEEWEESGYCSKKCYEDTEARQAERKRKEEDCDYHAGRVVAHCPECRKYEADE